MGLHQSSNLIEFKTIFISSFVNPSPILTKRESPWAPLSNQLFAAFWIAGGVSNLGTWIHESAAGMLMTHLQPSPVWVALVRTAMSLPIFVCALWAGTLADRLDRRRMLLATQMYLLCVTGLMCLFTAMGWMTPALLLVFTFCIGLGMCFHVPVWQSVIPEIVPRDQIPAAVGLGSLSFNLGRCLGPAVSGLVIGLVGFSIAFGLNALSFIGVILVLASWKRVKPSHEQAKPIVNVSRSVIDGIQFLLGHQRIRNVYLRLVLFLLPASVVWSLVYLIAKQQYGLDTLGQGLLISAFGLGAVVGAFVLPLMRRSMNSNAIVMTLSVAFGVAAIVIGGSTNSGIASVAMFVMGLGWMGVLTTLNATIQLNLPDNYRARGMSVYLTSMAFGIAVGAVIWGYVASYFGTATAFMIAGFATPAVNICTIHIRLRDINELQESITPIPPS